jgi:hypothetical protein
MLSSIHPLGERSRQNNWGHTVAFYIAGSTVAGLLTGALFGLAGIWVRSFLSAQSAALLLGAAAVVAVAIDAGWLRQPIRGHRQVN